MTKSNLTVILTLTAVISLIFAFSPHRFTSGIYESEIDTLSRMKMSFDKQVSDAALAELQRVTFPNAFHAVEGVTTFRGGPYRDKSSHGVLTARPKTLTIKWSFATTFDKSWGGGAGWTGQPLIVKWPDSTRVKMNLNPSVKTKTNFTEVIVGSLDGKIYFIDLETGKASRPPINIQNPIKGTLSIDPRGWPLLYAGQGISNTGEFGVRIFSLIDQKKLYFLNGRDPFAYRAWSAFDSSPLINAQSDYAFLGGENGVVYGLDLNSKWQSGYVTVSPEVSRYRYKVNPNQNQGVESSLTAWKDRLYFCDNNGYVQCLSIKNFEPIWVSQNPDDSDATLILEEELTGPVLYTGNEVDLQGARGFAFVRKLDGNTGQTLWEQKFDCHTIRGAHPLNGGMLSTPVLGKQKGKALAVFCLSRYKEMSKGLLVALDKVTGAKVWEAKVDHYAWSSPIDIYDKEGNMYIFLADAGGDVMLYDGANGTLIYKMKVVDLFEASPVAFGNKIVIPSRPRDIFCLEVQ
jgi:outer membrane protein assembly factor BamB